MMPIARYAAVLGLAFASAASVDPVSAAQATQKRASNQPLTLVVNLRRQRVVGYRGTEVAFTSSISSGKPGHRTPKGIFSIIQKRKRHFSNLYYNAPMPYMQRLTWSGIAFHAGAIPGYPASHGCVRLPMKRARQLFSMTGRTARVVISNGSPRPAVVSHTLLWNRLPKGENSPAVNVTKRNASRRDDGLHGPNPLRPAVNAVFGVTPAVARAIPASVGPEQAVAPSAPDAVRTRADVKRRDEVRRQTLETDLKAAVEAIAEIKRDQKARYTTARAAARHLRELKVILVKAQRAESKWQRQLAGAEQKLRVFLVKNADVVATDPRYDALAEREQTLAAAVARALDELSIAEAERKDIESAVANARATQTRTVAAAKSGRLAMTKALHRATKARSARDLFNKLQKLRGRPVHILVSRRTSKIHVRQGYQDIIAAPITFEDPQAPVGTHLIQAVAEADDETTLQWVALTVPETQRSASRKSKSGKRRARRSQRKRQTAQDKRAATSAKRLTVRAALNRVKIPAEIHRKITELVKVGSTLTVSDHGPSHETGKGTDFIVLTR
ncbi:MAG: L,D-transpeptidase family protein [Pseudomonadota bacterium]